MENVPNEIWLKIFSTVSTDPSARAGALVHLCGVCARWRNVASSAPLLWTTLPKIDLYRVRYQHIDRMASLIRLFLTHSGNDLPISFELAFGSGGCRTNAIEEYKPVYDALLSERHRWKEVSLLVPLQGLRSVPPGILGITTMSLTNLKVCFSGGPALTTIGAMFDLMDLPSLVDLEVKQPGNIVVHTSVHKELCVGVLALIRRSRCSLQRLALGTGFAPLNLPILRDIFSLSPDLVTLDVTHNQELRQTAAQPLREHLQMLVASRSGNTPLHVPKLRTLIIRELPFGEKHGGTEYHLGLAYELVSLRAGWMHGEFVIRLRWSDGGKPMDFVKGMLKTVYVQETLRFANVLYSMDRASSKMGCETPLVKNALSVFNALEPLNSNSEPADDWLRGMVITGAVTCMRSLSLKNPNRVPGEVQYKFRKRARSICDYWEPFLRLEASKPSWSFRWSYVDRKSVSLSCQEYDPDEDIWTDIARIAKHHPLSQAKVNVSWLDTLSSSASGRSHVPY